MVASEDKKDVGSKRCGGRAQANVACAGRTRAKAFIATVRGLNGRFSVKGRQPGRTKRQHEVRDFNICTKVFPATCNHSVHSTLRMLWEPAAGPSTTKIRQIDGTIQRTRYMTEMGGDGFLVDNSFHTTDLLADLI
ncbi:hypothetical protein S40288_10538 [Stachybotrys chartarum IBT 40288]|nr:hypothetical protein S40288_10538 [Stachybotrys chartarum IBT 40288]